MELIFVASCFLVALWDWSLQSRESRDSSSLIRCSPSFLHSNLHLLKSSLSPSRKRDGCSFVNIFLSFTNLSRESARSSALEPILWRCSTTGSATQRLKVQRILLPFGIFACFMVTLSSASMSFPLQCRICLSGSTLNSELIFSFSWSTEVSGERVTSTLLLLYFTWTWIGGCTWLALTCTLHRA